MSRYNITGGNQLSGRIKANGNKNAALPCLVATLLTTEEVILRNVPDIADVKVLIAQLEKLGSTITRLDDESYSFKTNNIDTSQLDENYCKIIRASILLLAPLLTTTGSVALPPPGGDVIGRRRIDTHILALESLGATFHLGEKIHFTAPKGGLQGADMFLDEASVTATENAVMGAVLAQGDSCINNAACEPHVQDLCNMLNSMGARITGIGSNQLHIEGVKKLHGCEFTIGFDFMEAVSYLALGAVTNSEIEITHINPEHLRMSLLTYNRLGINWEYSGNTVCISSKQKKQIQPDLGGNVPVISDAPWPGFPPDVASITIVAATQCQGTVLIHEKMFESRMFFVDKLVGMGANIILCDPHRAVISGARQLHGDRLTSPDVRAGMALILAALCADGQSTIDNIYQVERGYANLVKNLKTLGADIQRTE